MINIFNTFAFKYICPFFYPFIRHPFVSIKNWASTVYHVHVRSTTSFHIMPKNSRAFYRCHCDAQSRKRCIATFWYLSKKMRRLSVLKLGLKCSPPYFTTCIINVNSTYFREINHKRWHSVTSNIRLSFSSWISISIKYRRVSWLCVHKRWVLVAGIMSSDSVIGNL